MGEVNNRETRGPTLRSSRRVAVRWPGASAPRFSATLRVALPGCEGTWPAERKNVGPATRGNNRR